VTQKGIWQIRGPEYFYKPPMNVNVTAEVSPSEVGFPEVGFLKVRHLKIGFPKVRLLKIGFPKNSPLKLGFAQVDSSEVNFAKAKDGWPLPSIDKLRIPQEVQDTVLMFRIQPLQGC
jgi:hypothetical protein